MTNTQHTNENLTLHFKVKDFNAWRTGYNGNEKGRVSAGMTNGKVFRSADDPNEVVVLQDVADVAPEILRHRLILTYDALADGVTTDDVIARVLATMPVPQVTPRQESGLQDTA